ncbi:MAG: excinuclease ABC subunit UvrA [Deltaproteobacteria bacterium]|nr:excinuclease ABC subunit UvrA [Deltaproteobacteria bacterium]
MMEPDTIVIRGAREHNLKGIDVTLPKKQLVVLTGVSGSGKSSLAFDTLYAEGQRRYVESLSSYARQFLGQMEKPHFETIKGLSPTIAIEQKAASNNPRSTVGTITEIHDYLRVLFASIGVQYCHQCGQRVGKQGAQQIVEEIEAMEAGQRAYLLAPIAVARKGEHRELLADVKNQGFARVRVDGALHRLDEEITLEKKKKHTIEIVVDRLVIGSSQKARLTDSVETALKAGGGTISVATVDDAGAFVAEGERVFSAHLACTTCGISFPELRPHTFSFNSPLGFCESCNGLGTRNEMDPDLIVPDPTRSIREGAVEPWASAMVREEGWTFDFITALTDAYEIDLDRPWEKLAAGKRELILHGTYGEQVAVKSRHRRRRVRFEGVVNRLMRRFKETTSDGMRKYYLKYFSTKPCHDCEGGRLRPESQAVRVGGRSIIEISSMTIRDAKHFFETIELTETETVIASELLKEIGGRLRFLHDVGLGYLTLDRAGPSLSGGEAQRIRLASQLGSELTGVIYVLDEPSIGLHARDNGRLLRTLERLRDIGNSVLVVEHDQETMEAADYLVDFGPGAGRLGGEVVAAGTPEEVKAHPRSLTGAFLTGRESIEIPEERRAIGPESIQILGATEHNLKDVDVTIPLGGLVAVTGVSGAGKSTLVTQILIPQLMRTLHASRVVVGKHKAVAGLEHLDKVIHIDQKPIGRTPRSNPATYTKVFDAIRKVFATTPEARAYGYQPGRFSFNVKGGRCDACSGDGVRMVEMHFLADVYVPCEVCNGLRFNEATLRVRYKGKNIAEVLEMSVNEALEHFAAHKEIVKILRTLEDVGLGYIHLGQPSPTLSGGEAQRVKLSRELARASTGRTLYVLDEPTTGLHFADIQKLLGVLDRLVDAGNTVLVIEHNLDVIKCADWIIDLGPEGGDEGGEIVAVGTPEEVAGFAQSHTGEALRALLPGAKRSPRKKAARRARR